MLLYVDKGEYVIAMLLEVIVACVAYMAHLINDSGSLVFPLIPNTPIPFHFPSSSLSPLYLQSEHAHVKRVLSHTDVALRHTTNELDDAKRHLDDARRQRDEVLATMQELQSAFIIDVTA